MSVRILAIAITVWLGAVNVYASGLNNTPLFSPNGDSQIALHLNNGSIAYSVKYKGNLIIDKSQLGLIIDGQEVGSQGITLKNVTHNTQEEVITNVIGKVSEITSRFNEQTLHMTSSTKRPLKFTVILRAYDSGVAIRYHLPAQPNLKSLTVQNELTQFSFPKNYSCHGLNLGKFTNSHEGEYDPFVASNIREHHLYHAPVVCKTGVKNTTFALAEANVKGYPGAWFTGKGDGTLGLQTKLTPLTYPSLEEVNNKVAAYIKLEQQGFFTPWRVIMLGDWPGALTESTLIYELGEPSTVKNTQWIKPGKVAWDWWNNNQVAIKKPGMNTATYLAYIDFAATVGLEYILIDAGWHEGAAWTAKKGANLIKPIKDMDMGKILQYAKSKNVGVWVWVQWKQLDWQMEAALSAYSAWGIKGIKVDFMDRYDQPMVGYYHKLLASTGRHQLMVDLHGAYSPNGLARTYPHYLTQEGVLGAEYNKWSHRITATHNVTLPFTRMILGPIDYTPGGFKHVSAVHFKPWSDHPNTYVKTTRGQALAMYVVYDSPLQMLADSPINYSKTDGVWPQPKNEWQAGLEFIQRVPVTWDETRVIAGEIGQFIVMARRKGRDWYVGAMTNEEKRKVKIKLDFLQPGKYQAQIWEDGKTMASLKTHSKKVSKHKSLTLKMAASGGAVVHLTAPHAL